MEHLWNVEMTAQAPRAAVCFFKQNPWECLISAAELQQNHTTMMASRRLSHQDHALKPQREALLGLWIQNV